MDWLMQNWIWVMFFVLFIGMHLFGHGGCGRGDGDEQPPAGGERPGRDKPQGHQH